MTKFKKQIWIWVWGKTLVTQAHKEALRYETAAKALIPLQHYETAAKALNSPTALDCSLDHPAAL